MVNIVSQKVNCYDRDILEVHAIGFIINSFKQFHHVPEDLGWSHVIIHLKISRKCYIIQTFTPLSILKD